MTQMVNCNVEDPGSISGLGRSLGEGNDNPFQYSYLENSMDRGAWQTTVHGIAKSWTQLSRGKGKARRCQGGLLLCADNTLLHLTPLPLWLQLPPADLPDFNLN